MKLNKDTIKKWKKAIEDARIALSVLVDTQTEIREILDEVPEEKSDDPMTLTLQEICDLDLSVALDTVEEAEGIVLN